MGDVQRTMFLPLDLDQRIQGMCEAEGKTFYAVTERLLRLGLRQHDIAALGHAHTVWDKETRHMGRAFAAHDGFPSHTHDGWGRPVAERAKKP